MLNFQATAQNKAFLLLSCPLYAWLSSCVTKRTEFKTVASVELQRFMGDWYVQGHTPLFIDENSSDQRESYQLDQEGGIQTVYTFKKNEKWHHYRPYGRVADVSTRAHWKMQFIWPFSSDYLIVRLDENYATTVVSVPEKDKIWIMSRQRMMDEAQYDLILTDLKQDGYPIQAIRRVAQSQELMPQVEF